MIVSKSREIIFDILKDIQRDINFISYSIYDSYCFDEEEKLDYSELIKKLRKVEEVLLDVTF